MTTFTAPLKVEGVNNTRGNAQTDSTGYVNCRKFVSLGGAVGATRQILTLPPKSMYIGQGFIQTSAFGGVDTAASAMVVSFGNSTDATRYGVFHVSAGVPQRTSFTVSAGNDFESGGTVVITLSALSTTTYTGGGRAFVEYTTTE